MKRNYSSFPGIRMQIDMMTAFDPIKDKAVLS